MAVQVSFRIVGLFCYFENLQLDTVNPDSKVKDVIKSQVSGFDYTPISLGGKEIVDTMSYDFTNSSTTPYNTSGRPMDGFRDLSNVIADTSLVWQYYRSVTGTINGLVCELKLFTEGQPSYATTDLNSNYSFFGTIPEGFEVHTYNLTWRLVQIQMSPERQAKFLAAKAKVMEAKALAMQS